MTVLDLRERLGLGRLPVSLPSPRRPVDAVGSLEGSELYRRHSSKSGTWRLALLDVVCALVVATAGVLISDGLGRGEWVGILVAWPIALRASGAYRRSSRGSRGAALVSVGRAAGLLFAGIGLLTLVVPDLAVRTLVATSVVVAVTTLAGRSAVDRWTTSAAAKTPTLALVRGSGRDVGAFLEHLAADDGESLIASAVQVTDGLASGTPQGHDSGEGMAGDLVSEATRSGVDVVVLVGSQPECAELLRRTVWRLEGRGISTYLVPIVADLSLPRLETMGGSGVPMLSLSSRDLGAEVGVTKVIIDKLLALAALLLLSPVILATGLAVRLSSPGPVLFRQIRVGLRGREFEMLKFRTMHRDAEAQRQELEEMNRHAAGTLFKLEDDPRITRVGHVLRKYSLDELPQLFNVLRGEMSLVGPRPPLPEEVAQYPVDAHRRFCVRPGLTGLWQVSGRSDLDPEESIRLDMHYVEHWSPAMDTRILMRTPGVVISGKGAY